MVTGCDRVGYELQTPIGCVGLGGSMGIDVRMGFPEGVVGYEVRRNDSLGRW